MVFNVWNLRFLYFNFVKWWLVFFCRYEPSRFKQTFYLFYKTRQVLFIFQTFFAFFDSDERLILYHALIPCNSFLFRWFEIDKLRDWFDLYDIFRKPKNSVLLISPLFYFAYLPDLALFMRISYASRPEQFHRNRCCDERYLRRFRRRVRSNLRIHRLGFRRPDIRSRCQSRSYSFTSKWPSIVAVGVGHSI